MVFDLSFVDKYDRDVEKFGKVRNATISMINERALSVMEEFHEYSDQEMLAAELQADIPAVNDRILASENFRREDMESGSLPAYMEDRVYDETGLFDEDHRENIASAQDEVFDALYHVHDVLTQETRENLGQVYQIYCAQRMAAEQKSQEQDMQQFAASQNGMKSTFRNEKGETYLSLVDPNGEDTRDDYSFDEI